ncbi:MAG: ABC transporter permease [Sulfuricella denitrificans]|nr:ABC transporter permease [Sulfuricella denitrificans]
MIATIAAKELKQLFGSPLAWITLGVLQGILAWLFLNQVDAFLGLQAQLSLLVNPPGVTEMVVAPLYWATALLLLAITPILAMRLIAEERRNHTLPLLFSAPVSLRDIVLGKFFGLWIFLCLIVILATLMAFSLRMGGQLDMGLLLANQAGIVLLAACLAALGLYFSALTAHPAVAAISSIGASLGLWLLDIVTKDLGLWHALSLLWHFERISRGFLNSADIAYFLLFILTFLTLAARRLDQDRVCG